MNAQSFSIQWTITVQFSKPTKHDTQKRQELTSANKLGINGTVGGATKLPIITKILQMSTPLRHLCDSAGPNISRVGINTQYIQKCNLFGQPSLHLSHFSSIGMAFSDAQWFISRRVSCWTIQVLVRAMPHWCMAPAAQGFASGLCWVCLDGPAKSESPVDRW